MCLNLPPPLRPGLSGSNAAHSFLCCWRQHATSLEIALQIFFLGEISQIPFGERHFGSDDGLAFALLDGHNPSAKIPSFPVLLEELLEIGSIHDSIFYRVGAAKGEPQNPFPFFFCPT